MNKLISGAIWSTAVRVGRARPSLLPATTVARSLCTPASTTSVTDRAPSTSTDEDQLFEKVVVEVGNLEPLIKCLRSAATTAL